MTQLPDPGAEPPRRRIPPEGSSPAGPSGMQPGGLPPGSPPGGPAPEGLPVGGLQPGGALPGSERYVRFLGPHERASSPYTVEGYLTGISSFATGAVRVRGWRRTAAKVLVVLLLLPIALTVLHWIWTLLLLLISF